MLIVSCVLYFRWLIWWYMYTACLHQMTGICTSIFLAISCYGFCEFVFLAFSCLGFHKFVFLHRKITCYKTTLSMDISNLWYNNFRIKGFRHQSSSVLYVRPIQFVMHIQYSENRILSIFVCTSTSISTHFKYHQVCACRRGYDNHLIVLPHWDITYQQHWYYICRNVTLYWQQINQLLHWTTSIDK